jgi:hypothetical protein
MGPIKVYTGSKIESFFVKVSGHLVLTIPGRSKKGCLYLCSVTPNFALCSLLLVLMELTFLVVRATAMYTCGRYLLHLH